MALCAVFKPACKQYHKILSPVKFAALVCDTQDSLSPCHAFIYSEKVANFFRPEPGEI